MLIYGKQPIYHLIERHPSRIQTLFLAKELEAKEYNRIMRLGFEVKRIPQNAAQVMSKNGNHQGFLAEVEAVEPSVLSDLHQPQFIVLLSGVTDVGNIGAIIRSAYALGVDALAVCGIRSLGLEGIARSSSGALFELPLIVEHNILDLINELKTQGFTFYGADMQGADIRDAVMMPKRALVLGNEGEGIAPRVAAKIEYKVRISMAHEFDSLNVSAAGAIMMDRMRYA